MQYVLNEKLRQLVPYEPDSGDYAIRLDANESFLSLPQNIKSQLCQTISQTDLLRYPDPLAKNCCNAFAEYYGINSKLVTAGNGSDELISVILTAFTQKGDNILTLIPDFSMYDFYATLAECNIISIQKDDELNIDVNKVIKKINTENIKLIIFSNPCNPTSLGLKKADVIKIITQTNALVVLDEAYMDFWDQSLLFEVEKHDNLIILRTCSKMIGMAGIRLGFAVASKTLTNALKAAKSPYNVNTLTQTIGQFILSQKSLLEDSAKTIINSKQELYNALLNIKGFKVFKSCTNFLLIETENPKDVFDSLKSKGILVRNLGKYLRITAGSKTENSAVINALKQFQYKGEFL